MAIGVSGRGSGEGKRSSRWRGLILFWALVLAILVCGAVTLQVLGPPTAPARSAAVPPRNEPNPEAPKPQAPKPQAPKPETPKPETTKPEAAKPEAAKPEAPKPEAPKPGEPKPEAGKPGPVSPAPSAATEPAPHAAAEPAVTPPPPARSPVDALRPGSSAASGPIAAPDPALLEPGADPDAGMLPRIGKDGRTPGQAYSRGFTADPAMPRIALVVAGIGLNSAESMRAIQGLPGGFTLAVSPYAAPNPALLNVARQDGHELLLAIPLEPVGYPRNDPGEHALLTGATEEDNTRNLEWALGRFAGYAGVTAALGGQLNGERFPAVAEQMQPMLRSLASRGLFYVDPRILPPPETGKPQPVLPYLWNRSIDVIVDDPADAASIEAKLAALEDIARDKGSALGLVELASPVALDRLAAWSNGLAARGFALAPASAVMLPPGKVPE